MSTKLEELFQETEKTRSVPETVHDGGAAPTLLRVFHELRKGNRYSHPFAEVVVNVHEFRVVGHFTLCYVISGRDLALTGSECAWVSTALQHE